ncbi:hypothetical protein LguiB_012561 [Lonicera macranthoides]
MDVVVSHVFRERNRVANLLANVESKLRETTWRLEQQLVEEQAARLKAEENAQAAKMKSNDEICELRGNLQKAQRETVELRNRSERSRENPIQTLSHLQCQNRYQPVATSRLASPATYKPD